MISARKEQRWSEDALRQYKARNGRWVTSGSNVDFNVPIQQPCERSTSGGTANRADRANPLTTSRAATDDQNIAREQQTIVSPLTNKYHNVLTNGYHSIKESKRADELRLLEKAGAISDLREQVPFVLIPRQLNHDGIVAERACVYKADFVYTENGVQCVEDAKGVRTADYIVKRKLMRFTFGIAVRET